MDWQIIRLVVSAISLIVVIANLIVVINLYKNLPLVMRKKEREREDGYNQTH